MMYLSQALSFSTFMACIFFLMASMLLLLLTSQILDMEKHRRIRNRQKTMQRLLLLFGGRT